MNEDGEAPSSVEGREARYAPVSARGSENAGDGSTAGGDERRPAIVGAQDQLNRLLAEFRLFGGFAGPDGMRLWGDIQRAVRELDRLRAESGSEYPQAQRAPE